MIRRRLALFLCLSLLVLSVITHGQAYLASEKFSHFRDEAKSGATNETALSLPKGKAAWLIEISRSGGMRPVKETVRLNSTGEINVTSEQLRNGSTSITCSRKEKLSARDLLKIKAAVASARPSVWKDNYSDPAHPVCCDQPTTEVKLEWHNDKGKGQTYSTSWYPGSYSLVPTDLKAIGTFIQPLWDAARDRCN